jgi:hypothetical protein
VLDFVWRDLKTKFQDYLRVKQGGNNQKGLDDRGVFRKYLPEQILKYL